MTTADSKRMSGDLSGLHWEAERCPHAKRDDDWKPAVVGGAVGYGLGYLLGTTGMGRLVMTALGVGAGAISARYHFNIDWDPDRLRGRTNPDSDRQRPL